MKRILILLIITLTSPVFGQVDQKQNPTDFIPKGFEVFEKISGDLNKDGIEDLVLLIKGTDKNKIITHKFRGQLDLNRRGIIALFFKNGNYELASHNYDCFSSEDDYSGVYFAPELSVEIKNGNLLVHYGHGRYGYWKYTFRFQSSDFDLIGYDGGYKSDFESDWVTFDEESINFLSKKKLTKEVTKVADDGTETFKETWKKISVNKLLKLSEIKDFDNLDMTDF